MVKLGLHEPTISYLSYPRFETDPHPALERSLKIDLRTFRPRIRDYREYSNPPILHRKELFVRLDHSSRPKFARLTAQEERWGLYEDGTTTIGTQNGWNRRLATVGAELRGHRLVRSRAT